MAQRTDASIVAYFSILKDPRIERHKKHNLVDILVLAICGVLSGAEGWEAIEEYGQLCIPDHCDRRFRSIVIADSDGR